MHIHIYFSFPRYIIAVVIVCRLCFLVHHGFYDCPKLPNKSARRRKTLLLRPLLRRTFENYIPKIYEHVGWHHRAPRHRWIFL